ncbi:PREDICTED: microtubule-associated protein 10 [Propithecus coquereli]|uniref:microtubule-associated protein 10 n=1 Tax=Propithecus coquereli TaxID=379532 RepID=UPI00063F61F2|nr:PREDICTED: microtubule-associated protein 10 [Propithecus coquereli]
MAAALSERLFSLEVVVDWVRLETRLLPPSAVAVEQEEASPPRSLCPAVAFRLLDFPTLLVYPPDGPAAPAPEPRPGVISFGRGKSCLFRLHPATLHRLLLRTPLYTLLLQLPPGRPTPAPQLLGSCNISLAATVQKVLGPAACRCSQGHRGRFSLHNRVGKQIGDIALAYRLTDLGSRLLGHLERPVTFTSIGCGVEHEEVQEAVEVSSQTPQEKQQLQQPASEPSPRDTDRPPGGLEIPKAQKDLKEIVFHTKANSDNASSVENGKTNSVVTCPNACRGRSIIPLNEEVTELDIETNTFCPPPLYYTHLTQEKLPSAQVKITIEPQVNVLGELDGAFPENKHMNSPTYRSSPKHTNSATDEGPPMLVNPPHIQDIGAVNQTTCHTQTEQNRINTIRQLPLLNALLVELSLLYDQPVASPTHIHPHLAWLYRTEEKKASESSAKSTCQSESKEGKLSVGECEKSVSLQPKKNQVENPKKSKYFEKNSGTSQKRVPRGKLLYGLTNTLRLRLKQTNPDMLVVHEKREQYRKMQAQMLGTKFRIPSSKVKILSFAEQNQKSHQLPKDKHLDSDTSFAENSGTSRQISGVFDEPSTTKEIKLKCATEKKRVDCGKNRTNNGSLEEIVSPANSIIPERFTHANILGGKVEVQSPCVFTQDAIDRVVADKEINSRQDKTTDNDILTADVNENRPSGNSCYENISELKYSDDFTSSCYSEDFYTTEDTSRSLQAHDSNPGAENPKHSQYTSQSSETKLSVRKNSSEKSSILSPPFSAGSPVHSYRRSRISKTQDKSLEEASSISTSDLSSSHWTEEKENQIDQNGMHVSKVIKRDQDISFKLKTRTGCKSVEKSQSPQTSQVSSYLPSNLSELELNVLNSSTSDHFEEDSDDVGSLNISKQCKDICELVINKLPGYTM